MKVLVAGNRGMLAQDLIPSLKKAGIQVKGFDLPDFDITILGDISQIITDENPSMVINCAAYTAVDKAEEEKDLAFTVNCDGAANLANVCRQSDIPLIHISTDFVFNGNSRQPYHEYDRSDPQNIYGKSKWEGEEAIRSFLDKHVIIRTAWLYGVHGHNFVKTMLELSYERDELRVVNDQTGCPTWTKDLADAIVSIVLSIQNPMLEKWGTYHFCGYGHVTWYGFACSIIEEARNYDQLKVKKIIPVTTEEFSTPAQRPEWSVLDTSKISKNYRIKPPKWETSLKKMVKELYKNHSKSNKWELLE